MKKPKSDKRRKLFFVAGIIATPLVIMTPYNWWLIATIVITFLVIAMITQGPKKKKRKL